MRRSEKILLAILVFGLLAWQGGGMINRWVFDPLRRSQDELLRLDEQIATQKIQMHALSRAKSQLNQWHRRSLPRDPLTAQRLYQQWLTDLAQDSGFTSLRVYPDRVTRQGESGVGVQVSIDATARLDQLCLFLSRFYRTELAQQITVLNIDSTQDRGDPALRVTIMAEGLALRGAQARQRLFATASLAGDVSNQELQIEVRDGTGFPTMPFPEAPGFLVRVDGELLRVSKIVGTRWTVQRGVEQTQRKSHRVGSLVELAPRGPGTGPITREGFADLLARNPFAKPTPPVVEPPRAPAADPVAEPIAIDPAEFTYLVAAFAQGDRRVHQAGRRDRDRRCCW